MKWLPIAAVVLLTGCATEPWPNLPSTTYSGTVINEPLGKPEPDATITASRPKEKPGLVDNAASHFWMESADLADTQIASTQSRGDGRFVLTVPSGYATILVATSHDGRLSSYLDHDLKHGDSNMVIHLAPHLDAIDYNVVAMDKHDCDLFESACEKIFSQYASTRYTSTLSIDEYARRGIITPEEYAYLTSVKPHLLGPHPHITALFPRDKLQFRSFSTPMEVLPCPPLN